MFNLMMKESEMIHACLDGLCRLGFESRSVSNFLQANQSLIASSQKITQTKEKGRDSHSFSVLLSRIVSLADRFVEHRLTVRVFPWISRLVTLQPVDPCRNSCNIQNDPVQNEQHTFESQEVSPITPYYGQIGSYSSPYIDYSSCNSGNDDFGRALTTGGDCLKEPKSRDTDISEGKPSHYFPLNIPPSSVAQLYAEPGLKVSSKTSLCRHWVAKRCTYGHECRFAHGDCEANSAKSPQHILPADEFYHNNSKSDDLNIIPNAVSPLSAECLSDPLYKTSICKHWEKNRCTYHDACRFAHGREDLRPRGSPDLQFLFLFLCNLGFRRVEVRRLIKRLGPVPNFRHEHEGSPFDDNRLYNTIINVNTTDPYISSTPSNLLDPQIQSRDMTLLNHWAPLNFARLLMQENYFVMIEETRTSRSPQATHITQDAWDSDDITAVPPYADFIKIATTQSMILMNKQHSTIMSNLPMQLPFTASSGESYASGCNIWSTTSTTTTTPTVSPPPSPAGFTISDQLFTDGGGGLKGASEEPGSSRENSVFGPVVIIAPSGDGTSTPIVARAIQSLEVAQKVSESLTIRIGGNSQVWNFSPAAGSNRSLGNSRYNGKIALFHGTSRQNADRILRDSPCQDMSDPWGDFGSGFYLSDSIVVAYQSALRYAHPCLLVFIFSNGWSEFRQLCCKTFSSGWSSCQDHWKSYVWMNRKGDHENARRLLLQFGDMLPSINIDPTEGTSTSNNEIDLIAGPICTNPPILNESGFPVVLPGGCRRAMSARHLAFVRYADSSRLVLTDRSDARKPIKQETPLVDDIWGMSTEACPPQASLEPSCNAILHAPLQFCFRTAASLNMLRPVSKGGPLSLEVWLFPPNDDCSARPYLNGE